MMKPVDVATILAAAGLKPGPDGYDSTALVAAIEGRGWTWSVEPREGAQLNRPRYRALVVAPSHWLSAGSGSGATTAARGRGATETVALAQALAQLLVMVDRRDRDAPSR